MTISGQLDITKLQPPGVTERLTAQMVTDLRTYWDSAGGLDRGKVELVDCSLCGTSSPIQALFARERFPYRRCPNCGLVYPSPRPRAQFLKDQYISGRFASAFHELYLPSVPYRMATIFKERIESIIAPRVPRGRLLDVGCSSGHFLKLAAECGYDVYGVEPNPAMVEYAQAELRLRNICCGTLANVGYPASYFDVITLWDVLEHVEQPGMLLKEVDRVLKPGGWVFAYTENFSSFNVLVTREYSEMISPDVHLRHYTSETFRREFEQAGFLVKEVYTHGLDLSHIRKTLTVYPEVFSQKAISLSPEREAAFQDVINQLGIGDNLRLDARKA